MKLISQSLEDTRQIGENLGSICRSGDVVCLGGGLGAGKTTLAQAIAKGAGVAEHEYVNSPSFALLHEYSGRVPIYHMDFYRLGSSEDVVALGLDEYLYGDGLALVEWFERAEDTLPDSQLVVQLSFIDDTSREISLRSNDPGWLKRIQGLENLLDFS